MTDNASNSPHELTFKDYKVVNIKVGQKLLPHLCVLVEDNEAYKAAAADPHYQLIITSVNEPLEDGTIVPLVLTHGHTFPTVDDLKDDTGIGDHYSVVDLPEGLSLNDVFTEELEVVTAKLEAHDAANAAIAQSGDMSSVVASPEPSVLVEAIERPDLNLYRKSECVEGEWSLLVPAAFITFSHYVFDAYPDDFPAFIILTEDKYDEKTASTGYTYDDVDFIVEYEVHDGKYIVESNAEIRKLLEGEYVIAANSGEMEVAGSILMDKITRLASGDITVLDDITTLMKILSRLVYKENEEAQRYAAKPKSDEILFHEILSLLITLYNGTRPEALFDILYQSEVLNDRADTVEDLKEHGDLIENIIAVENLFSSDDMKDIFGGVEMSYERPVLPPNARENQLIDFYTTPLTPDTFPLSMEDLKMMGDFKYAYENNIMSNTVVDGIRVTDDNAEQLLTSMLLVLGVRFARMQEMRANGLDMSPINVLFLLIQQETDIDISMHSFVYALSNLRVNGSSFLRELCMSRLPDSAERRAQTAQVFQPGTDRPLILSLFSVSVAHSLSHAIMDEGLNLKQLSERLSSGNFLKEYVLNLEDELIELIEEQPMGPNACPELVYGMNLLFIDVTAQQLVDALLELLVAAANFSASLSLGDDKVGDWEAYVDMFYEALLNK